MAHLPQPCLHSAGDSYEGFHPGDFIWKSARPRVATGRPPIANDFEAEHRIYREDAVLEYPQSGERISARQNIQASRTAQPNLKRFTVRRIIGAGDFWVAEFVLTYDGRPFYTVSIMEFEGGQVVRETQYFGDPFDPGPSRTQFVERTR